MNNLGQVLREKLEKAQAEGKVLNVSNLREDGVGAVKAKRPATSGRNAAGKIKYIEGLDIVSDNYGTYKVAAEALGFPQFARQYREFYGAGVASPKQPKSPKREKTEAKGFGERLLEAVENAQAEDKLVDVSNLGELKNGSLGGFRTVARYDAKTGRDTYRDKYTGKKMWIEGLPIISNNYESYLRAVSALDRADLAREFARKYGQDFDHRGESARGGAKSPAKSPAGGRGRSGSQGGRAAKTAAEELAKMYAKAVNEGAKLDVSGLDAAKGTGSRVIKPKSERQITKVGVPNLPEVVSNSHERYAEAMALLDEAYAADGQDTDFYERANEYFELHKAGPGKRAAGGSPKAKTPKRTRGQAIPKTGSAGSASSGSGGQGGRARSGSAGGRGRSGSAGGQGSVGQRSGSAGRTQGQETLADRLARAASLERMRSASQERRARSASQGRSGSVGSRSGSAGLLPVPDML